MVLGTFGVHQFYLGHKRRGYYLLITCGISHLMILLNPDFIKYIFSVNAKVALVVILSGYILGVPVWLFDLVTLYWQVEKAKKKQREASPPA